MQFSFLSFTTKQTQPIYNKKSGIDELKEDIFWLFIIIYEYKDNN